METMQLNVVSLEKDIFSGTVDMVVVTAAMGELGIMAGHMPLLTTIKPGQIRIAAGDSYEVYYVTGGILEVQPTVVTILADTVRRAEDLDEAAAIEARNGAKGVLADRKSNANFAEALAQIAHATAQLRTIQLLRYGNNKKINKR
jgi:F-type H+-transporting ATPase subunit epsilon